MSLDGLGRPATDWAVDHGLVPALHGVEVVFAQPVLVAVAVLVAAVLAVRRAWGAAVLVAGSTAATTVATAVLKDVVGRARPEWQVAAHAIHTPAFPSGHTSGTTALVLALLVVTGRRGGAAVAGALTVLLVAADRVLLGRHYPSDVLGGMVLGVLVVGAGVLLLGLLASRWPATGDSPARWSPTIRRAQAGSTAPYQASSGWTTTTGAWLQGNRQPVVVTSTSSSPRPRRRSSSPSAAAVAADPRAEQRGPRHTST